MTPFDADSAATQLTDEERAGLTPEHITERRELNAFEAENILEAELWAFGRKHKNLLSEELLLRLHKRMFGRVWRWAGSFRASDKNLGIAWWQIPTETRTLLDDVRYWVEHATYGADECAVRFHHRLVAIHPFANGNGRHSRLMADLLARQLGTPRFTWGSANLTAAGEVRARYVQALQAADHHDYSPLLAFARS